MQHLQRGRYRQFWQVGAEAIGSASAETDAELIVLLSDLLEAVGVRGTRLHLASLGTAATRAAYREELQTYLHAHEDQLPADVRSRIDINPMRAFDSSDPGTRAIMRDAPKLLDRLAPDDAEHFAQVRRCSTTPASATSSIRRSSAAWTTTPAPCGSSPATSSALSPASAAEVDTTA